MNFDKGVASSDRCMSRCGTYVAGSTRRTGIDLSGCSCGIPGRARGLFGNNPIYRDEFEQYYYRGPDDDKLNGAINSVEEGNILMDNHSLIASNSEDNKKALENMRGIVTR